MTTFKKSDVKIFTNVKHLQPESAYWKRLNIPVIIKEYGAVDYIHFTSTEPYYFAVTSSARVQIYDSLSKVHKNLNKFKETAYGGSFGNNDRLLCAGSEDAIVRLFDITERSVLRRFKGHTGAVHRTYFTSDNRHITSFSDDRSVILWDIVTEQKVTHFQDHQDYIRAGGVSPVSPNIVISGCYDGLINLYDTRESSTVFTIDHGAPVECVLFSPSGSVFVSAGGKEVRVWDAFTRKLLKRFSHYHKTVTCMCYSAKGKHLLTGSLDKRVKIIDTKSYNVLHTVSYISPILSVAVSKNENMLVTGMVNGMLSVHKRVEFEQIKLQRKIPHRYVGDTASDIIVDVQVPAFQKDRLPKYESALRKFQYSKAMDMVMVNDIAFKKPSITVTVFNELIRRRGLMSAVSGRNSKYLARIFRFLIRFLTVDRFSKVLIEVSDTIADAYQDIINTYSSEVKNLFRKLRDVVSKHINNILMLAKLQGVLEMQFSAANYPYSNNQSQQKNVLQLEPAPLNL